MLQDRLAELSARARFGMDLDLSRMRTALAELSHPEEHLLAVHVAGSNGKGSTCAMLESIARSAGLSTGLYTSPHLSRFAERVRLGGAPVADDLFERCLARALTAASGSLTFFETLTATAFLAFREACVDLAIIEVGLGGRLDATNTLPAPLACAITSISLEHTSILGSTLDLIAREKAGILKPGVPYVLGPLPLEAERAIESVARDVSAGPRWPGALPPRPTALRGPHQRRNAALAAALAEMIAPRFPAADLRAAIAPGLASVAWPGRFEKLPAERGVTVLFDGAHNDEGTAALLEALKEDGISPERTTLVFGALADKSWEPMLRALVYTSSRHVYTSPKGRSPAPLEHLSRIAPGACEPDPARALRLAIERTPDGGTVLVTGSLYLVGELRAVFLGLASDPVIAL
ncbi:MAG: folylpolyglutamate synthase/dihydrofolate synthase family protein [Polyangiaceae bacterium]